jgi:hypothetical protein
VIQVQGQDLPDEISPGVASTPDFTKPHDDDGTAGATTLMSTREVRGGGAHQSYAGRTGMEAADGAFSPFKRARRVRVNGGIRSAAAIHFTRGRKRGRERERGRFSPRGHRAAPRFPLRRQEWSPSVPGNTSSKVDRVEVLWTDGSRVRASHDGPADASILLEGH